MGIRCKALTMTGRGKGGKGLGKGGAKKSPEGQHSGHYQASYPETGKKRRSQEDRWSHLRRDEGCPEGVPGECHPRRRHLHRACQEEDCHCHGRCLCFKEAGQNSVRVRRLMPVCKSWALPSRNFHAGERQRM